LPSTKTIIAISFSPDGRYIAAGAEDKMVKVWEVATGSMVRTLAGHRELVWSVSFSPDGKYIASASQDETAKIWSAETGQCIHTLKGHTRAVYWVAFSPDGKYLVSGSNDGDIKLWDIKTGECIRTTRRSMYSVFVVLFSPDGKYLVSAYGDGVIKVWNAEDGELIHTLQGHLNGVGELAFSPDGKHLVSGSWDETIKLWNIETGSCIHTLEGHTDNINSVAFSPDGKYLASGSYDRSVFVWDMEGILPSNKPPVARFAFFPAAPATGNIVSYNGSTSSDPDGTISSFKWDFGDGAATWGESVTHVFTRSGTYTVTLTVTDNDGASDFTSKPINVPDVNTPPEARFTFSPPNPDTSSGVSFNGSTSSDSDGTIRTFKWNFGDGSSDDGKYVTHRFSSPGMYTMTLTVTDDDVESASTSETITIRKPNVLPVASFTWSRSEGTRVAVESRNGDLIVFDASSSYDPDGQITSYAWDWNSDGIYDEPSNTPNVEHQFATSGEHKVTLQVTDNEGATAKVTKTTLGTQPPTADFSFEPTSPSILDTVQFDAVKSSDPDGYVTDWKWDFGDGTTSTSQKPTHQYSQKGTYTVVLTVTDNDHLTGTKPASITVVNIPPVAQFTFSPEHPKAGAKIEFDASESHDPDGEITSYFWDFDSNGTIDAEGMVVFWSFPEEGSYTVSLTVIDKEGVENPEEMEVSVVRTVPVKVNETWAVVIGIKTYQDQWINDRFPVTYTEDDAQAFYNFLIDRDGGGFPEDHVHLLLGENATLKEIRKKLDWLTAMAEADDLVVVYFAGHGTYIDDNNDDEGEGDTLDECLVPYDAEWSSLAATTLVDDEIGYWFSNLACQHVLMIFDSCFSGGASRGARSFGKEGLRAAAGNKVFTDIAGAGKLFLAASREDESSYEYSSLQHGVFTYFLLRGLGDETLPEVKGLPPITEQEADEDGDGRVTAGEIQKYLESRVPLYVKQNEGSNRQNPVMLGDENLRYLHLDGYGIPLVGEVTAIDQERVIISLGSQHGLQPGDRFEVIHIHILESPDGQTIEEPRAIIEVLYVLGPNRAACRIIECLFPIEVKDQVRPVEE
jgi:WD40 repeat protein/uncharacterized caspase-like protein